MGVSDTPDTPDADAHHDSSTRDETAPAALADTILAAAGDRRAPNVPRAIGTDAAAPVTAFWQTAQELYGLLTGLSPQDWAAPTTTEYGTVKDLVAHLIGVERYCTRSVSHRDDADPTVSTAHTSVGLADIAELRDVPGPEVADIWFDAAGGTAMAFGEDDDDRPIDVHGIPAPADLALVFRTFEIWAHMEDVCAAVGRPLPRLDGPRMGLMAATLVGVLPLFFSEPDESQRGRVARIVLLGPGGGVADLALDPTAAGTAASARLVTDVVDFCRIASRRLPIDALQRHTTGDIRLLDPVLAAAAAFAMD